MQRQEEGEEWKNGRCSDHKLMRNSEGMEEWKWKEVKEVEGKVVGRC